MIIAGKILLSLGAKNVLIKGGHLNFRKVEDIFLNKSDYKIFNIYIIHNIYIYTRYNIIYI